MKYTRKVRFSYTTNCGAEYRTTWKCLPLVLFLFTLPHFLLLDWNNAFDTLDLCFSFSSTTCLCCLLNVFLSHSFLAPLHLICFLSFTFTRLLFANMSSCCLNLFKDQMLAVTRDSTGFCCHRKDGLPNRCAILTLAGKVERCFFC